MKVRRLTVALAWALASTTAEAWQCMGDEDPFEVVQAAFAEADLVFIGAPVEDTDFFSEYSTFEVQKVWKGRHRPQVSVSFPEFIPSGTNVYFLTRIEESPGWQSVYPKCYPSDSSLTIAEVLDLGAGKPMPPDTRAQTIAAATFIGVMVLAASGLAFFTRILAVHRRDIGGL